MRKNRRAILASALPLLSWPTLGAVQELAFFDPAKDGDATVGPSVGTVSLQISPSVETIRIPKEFYGLNVHPGSAAYEYARIDLIQQLRPDAVRIMTNLRSDWIRGVGRKMQSVAPQKGRYDWTELDLLVKGLTNLNILPYLTLGFGPPAWISGTASDIERAPPRPEHLVDYAELMADIASRYGAQSRTPVRRVAIENEPENVGYAINDYIRLFSLARERIKRRNPAVEVGGPSIGYADWKQPNGTSLSFAQTTQLLKKANVPLDFYDWHVYSTNPETVLRTAAVTRNILGPHTPLVISELNRDWRYSGEQKQVARNNNTGWNSVAWLAYLYDQLQAQGIDQVFYFCWREDSLGLVDSTSKVVRPNYYLIKAITHHLHRQRVQIRSSHPAIGCIATKDGNDIAALIYNRSGAEIPVDISGHGFGRFLVFDRSTYERNVDAKAQWPAASDWIGRAGTGMVSVPAGGFVLCKTV